jgi:hypothetical protein
MIGNFLIAGGETSNANFLAVPIKTYFDESNPYIINLYLGTGNLLAPNKAYKLRIMPSLTDAMGYMLLKQVEYPFLSSGSVSSKPMISRAAIISEDTIKVNFNKEISLEAPNIISSNYSLEYYA